jgi:transcription initiation factor TFIIIB Brf1 subunit/transcription initiation factor TFIIB
VCSMHSVGGGIRKVQCCEQPEFVFDSHVGDTVCSNCGIISIQNMFFETMNDKTYVYDTDPSTVHPSKKQALENKEEQKWLDKMNAVISYTNEQRMAWRLYTLLTDTMNNLPTCILNTVQNVLEEWVNDKDRHRSLSGSNRRGFVAACVYRACQYHNEPILMDHICTSFGICHSSFFNGRRVLYDWNKKNQKCDWFLKSTDNDDSSCKSETFTKNAHL